MLDRFDLIIELPEVDSRLLLESAPAGSSGDIGARQLLEPAVDKQASAARGFHRVLRVARTISNLAQSEKIDHPHFAEALTYRAMPLVV